MIHAVMVISTQAKPRLLKFYSFQVPILLISSLQSPLTPPPPSSPTQVLGRFPHPDQAPLHPWILSLSKSYAGEENSSQTLFTSTSVSWLQPPEKHQDLVRSVFQCMHGWLPHFFPNFVWFMYLELLESLVSVLSARPDGVSNFVKVDSIFGPVRTNLGYANASNGKRKGFNCYANCCLWF